jgi:hypothetical protein
MTDSLEILMNIDKIKKSVRSRISTYAGYVIYRTIGLIIKSPASPHNIEYKPDSHYIFRYFPEYNKLHRLWTSGNRTNNSGDISRLYMMHLNVTGVLESGVEGAIAEVGVYRGNSAAVLATIARKHHRKTFLFDTFEGFDKRDLRGIDAGKSTAFSDTSLERVIALVGQEDVTFVKGFFPESASTIEMPDKFAVVHIDCDLYEPIMASLKGFYPLMARNGLIMIHDYSSGHWPGARKAVDEFFSDKMEKPILMPDKSGTAAVRISSR